MWINLNITANAVLILDLFQLKSIIDLKNVFKPNYKDMQDISRDNPSLAFVNFNMFLLARICEANFKRNSEI